MKFKLSLVILASFLSTLSVDAQFAFGTTNAIVLGRPALQLVGSPQLGVSYSVQTSADGVSNWGPVNNWVPSSPVGTFVKLDPNQTGYYRIIGTSNQVVYPSTNNVVMFKVNIEIVEGVGRRITVNGPTNLIYSIQATQDLKVWSTIINGVSNQMIFTDSSNLDYLNYRAVGVSSG